MVSTPVKAVALLVFLGAIAGATYGVQTLLPQVRDGGIGATALAPALAAAPGANVTFPVTLEERSGATRDLVVHLSGGPVSGNETAHLVARNRTTAFVTVPVPAGAAPAKHLLELRLSEGGRDVLVVKRFAALEVLGDGSGVEEGDEGSFVLTVRLAEPPALSQSNDPLLRGAPFPRHTTFNPAQPQTPYSLATLPADRDLRGAILGMQEGESKTIRVERPAGNATVETIESARLDIERTYRLAKIPASSLSRAEFDDHLASTGQTGIDEVGEVFLVPNANPRFPLPLTLRITAIDDAEVRYELGYETGANFTLYSWWPNATRLVDVTPTEYVFETTPTETEGLTVSGEYPGMSRVAESNETHIVVRHEPPVGTAFARQPQTSPTPIRYVVREIRGDDIVLTSQNPSPFAGRDAIVDIRILELRKG